MAHSLRLTLLTTDPVMAQAADAAAVDWVGVDTERLGKHERQQHVPKARISDHTVADLARYAGTLRRAVPFARLDPWHPGLPADIEAALAAGARALMLPQFGTAGEAERFVAAVGGRAEVHLLVETPAAAASIGEILRVAGVDEIMVGLNDLHLALGLPHPMAVAVSPLLDRIAEAAHRAGRPFGFGGVARPHPNAQLPFCPDALLARYVELGASSAWISRSFFAGGLEPAQFPGAVAELRARFAWWHDRPQAERSAARNRLAAQVDAHAARTAAPRP